MLPSQQESPPQQELQSQPPPPAGDPELWPRQLPRPPPPLPGLGQGKPPPPPPPVLQSVLSPTIDGQSSSPKQNPQPGGTALNQTFTSVTQEARKACRIFLYSQRMREQASSNYVFLSSYVPVLPIIQNGPICGLVALAMVADLTGNKHVTTEQIFAEASRKGYSKQGEMFSVLWLQELASHFLPNKVTSTTLQTDVSGQNPAGQCLVHQLLQGNFVLIPYDADKNRGPCLRKGHKAHWAVLTGIFIAFRASDISDEVFSTCERDVEIPNLYYWSNSADETSNLKLEKLIREQKREVYVFGHQGKSKHAGIWSLESLLESTGNLVEVGPDRDSSDYVVPEGGIEAGLKSQMVVIQTGPTR